jgi:hypothetical protein
MPPSIENEVENAVDVNLAAGPLVSQENKEASLNSGKVRYERPAADPRRAMAQMTAKARWADWASKKTL